MEFIDVICAKHFFAHKLILYVYFFNFRQLKIYFLQSLKHIELLGNSTTIAKSEFLTTLLPPLPGAYNSPLVTCTSSFLYLKINSVHFGFVIGRRDGIDFHRNDLHLGHFSTAPPFHFVITSQLRNCEQLSRCQMK